MTLDEKDKILSVIDKQLTVIDENILLIKNEAFVKRMLMLRAGISTMKEKINSSNIASLEFSEMNINLAECILLFTQSAFPDILDSLGIQ